LGSNFLRAIDFALRFVIIIENTNFEFRFYWKYESRCKINGSQSLWTQFLVQRVLNLPHLFFFNSINQSLSYVEINKKLRFCSIEGLPCFDASRSAWGRVFTLGKLLKDEINTDVFAIIDEGARNHYPKEVVVLGYDTK
jgi:hypothetical protein